MGGLRLRQPQRRLLTGLAVFAVGLAGACRFDPSYRDQLSLTPATCSDGVVECRANVLVRCVNGAPITVDDCGAKSQACAPQFLTCTPCLPGEISCSGQDVQVCAVNGQARTTTQTCDTSAGSACRSGRCAQLCDEASQARSNVGCEYWPVDLDNAVVPTGNAAAQQYAVIVSNPQPDVAAKVTIEEDTSALGGPNTPRVVATASVGVRHLEVFKLGPREVDGSPPNVPNGGTGTALSRQAFRLRSDFPIVAYQFNPLDNVNVFSNDATILLPTSALNGSGRAYVVAGWPQTIARTSDPATNFGQDLRAFLTIVGTTPDTHVHLKSNARIVPGGPYDGGVEKGGSIDATLQPFEVLNLETGDFNADFTGTIIDSDAPAVVYVGSEASDAPSYDTLQERACCADHLESQVTPLRAVGTHYVIGRMPNRSKAVAAAGGAVQPFPEPELYKVTAVTDGTTTVTTTLPAPLDKFTLDSAGATVLLTATQDFQMQGDKQILVADMQVSQEAAGIPNGLPGGDPSLLFVPPTEQWRNDYILLTPDKYAFDFLVVMAPFGATVFLDGLPIDGTVCEVAPGDGLDEKTRGSKNAAYEIYRCQLSFPTIDAAKSSPDNVLPGKQNDGVHRVQSDFPLGVLVYGFDSFVSYAYAGGTELVDTGAH